MRSSLSASSRYVSHSGFGFLVSLPPGILSFARGAGFGAGPMM
jgi:hypothetical protein